VSKVPTYAPAGFSFNGWYYTEGGVNKDFGKDMAIMSNMDIYPDVTEIEPEEPEEPTPTPVPDTPEDEVPSEYMSPVIDVTSKTTEMHLVKGQSFTLPESGYKTSDKSKVSISSKNVIKAVKVTNNISVAVTKGSQTIRVFVTKPEITKSYKLEAGNTQKIGLTYDNAHLRVLWVSTKPDVATVDQNGVVTAVAKGTANIEAHINGLKYTSKITVTETKAAIKRTLHINVGKTKTLTLKGVKKYTWTIKNGNTVECKSGHKIKALKVGTSVITCTGKDGQTYETTVYVEDPTAFTVSGLTKTGTNKYKLTMSKGQVIAYGFSSLDQPTVFKSSKATVAFDTGRNQFKAVAKGKAKLTMKINGTTVTVNIEVK
nr:Ig-like domain-containing protein [Lachnospiraceae bacterium]